MNHLRITLVLSAHLLVVGLPMLPCSAQSIVAHRGASYDAPENTLAAFRLAWTQGADAIEGDFYVTKDDQIVCIHDKTTKRTAPGQPELKVADSTAEQLRRLDVGSWKNKRFKGERIPLLGEVLETVPEGKKILVEIKCGPEILSLLKPQLEQSGLKSNQILIICFDEAVVKQARRMMPQYKANWLTSYKQNSDKSQWKPTTDEVLASLKRTAATGLGTNGNTEVIDDVFFKRVVDQGFEFHVWTVNDVAVARRFAQLGVDSITTDKPQLIRESIGGAAGGESK